eukprot:Awhi_evm1s3533
MMIMMIVINSFVDVNVDIDVDVAVIPYNISFILNSNLKGSLAAILVASSTSRISTVCVYLRQVSHTYQ